MVGSEENPKDNFVSCDEIIFNINDIDDWSDSIDSMEDKFEISANPSTTPDKVGITIKASSESYITAHKIVSETMSEKRNRYIINGVEICILDT